MRHFLACLALLAPLTLGGCGFQPLYAERTGIARQLSGIQVETKDGRPSYELGLALRDELGSWQGEPRYILRTDVDMSRTAQSLTVADIATRYELRMQVSYALFDAATGERVFTGGATGRTAYDVPRGPYATLRAEEASEKRAARDAAHQIVIRLARALDEAASS